MRRPTMSPPFEICMHCAVRVGMYEPAHIQLADGTTFTGSVLGVGQGHRGEVSAVWHPTCWGSSTLATDAGGKTLLPDAGGDALSTDTGVETLSTDAGTETLSTDLGSETLSTEAGSEALAADVGSKTLEPAV